MEKPICPTWEECRNGNADVDFHCLLLDLASKGLESIKPHAGDVLEAQTANDLLIQAGYRLSHDNRCRDTAFFNRMHLEMVGEALRID